VAGQIVKQDNGPQAASGPVLARHRR
jgi:hypothetical protein